MIERSLVILKPDAVKRGLMGRIISRFEDAGLKIVGSRMVWIDDALGLDHYNKIGQLESRRGETILKNVLRFMQSGPVMILCIEGVNAVDNIRKIVGSTEPKGATPGTIRGDFAHMSYGYSDQQGKAIENLIHASSNVEEAGLEVSLWFKPTDIHSYKTVHEAHVF